MKNKQLRNLSNNTVERNLNLSACEDEPHPPLATFKSTDERMLFAPREDYVASSDQQTLGYVKKPHHYFFPIYFIMLALHFL